MTITDFFANSGQIKQYIRGIDASQELTTFAPIYRPAAKKLINLIGQETYDLLKAHIATPPQTPVDVLDQAVDYARSALANIMAISWFNFDAGQRNATDKKLYRYQENKIIENYLENAWAELDQLINLMEADIQKEYDDETEVYETPFIKFSEHDTYIQRDSLYIQNTSQFHTLYNIDSSSYFYYNVVYIMREVENEHIIPRFDTAPDDAAILEMVKKAIAFETVSIACQRFDYSELPKGIRNDISAEISGSVNRNELGSIKQSIATMLHTKAIDYLEKIDFRIKAASDTAAPVIPDEAVNSEDNKFYLST